MFRTLPALTIATLLGAGALFGGCETDGGRLTERVFEERASFRLVEDGDEALEGGRTDLAMQKYAEAVARHSGNFEARLKLAKLQLARGQYAEAASQLRIVRTERPGDAEVLDALALALARTGDAEGVERVLGERASITNGAADWLRYGRALFELGDFDRAEEALKRAAEADGGQNAVYQVALAQFAERIGDDERALRRYRMALYADPSDQAAREGIRRMGEVPGPSFALVPLEARPAAGADGG